MAEIDVEVEESKLDFEVKSFADEVEGFFDEIVDEVEDFFDEIVDTAEGCDIKWTNLDDTVFCNSISLSRALKFHLVR